MLQRAFAVTMVLACFPAIAQAGMPSVRLTDIAQMRLQTLSFFLVGFFVSAFCIQLLWNYLRKDWTFLPRLSYPRALGLVTLWGLLFVLVLTMISGARELMTPGAWEKQGLTYKLTQTEAEAIRARDQKRRERLELLGAVLTGYARKHDGQFPAERTDPAIPDELWLLPDTVGVRYIYLPGRKLSEADRLIACEPEVFEGDVFGLFGDGQVRSLSPANVRGLLSKD